MSEIGAKFRIVGLSTCVVSGFLGLAAVTLSATSASATMQTAGPALAPRAFYAFCKRDPGHCNSSSGEKIVRLTSGLEGQLKAVNAAVNRQVSEASDRATQGVADDWRLPGRVGDCEDFAIAKKSALMRRGWPASALLLTVVREDFGDGGHTVLTVRTTKGDLILDNRSGRVKDWRKTPYNYYARQSQTATGRWERIGR
jgi:predicted transglutaminase-like cysteine proteinase